MSKPIVYLAGPIAGQRYHDATHWRLQAEHHLDALGINTLSPMRAKSPLSVDNAGWISRDHRDYAHHGAFFTSRGITERDLFDLQRADLILANLNGELSYGTTIELAWAYLQRTPVVAFGGGLTADNHITVRHPMLREVLGDFRAEDLPDALEMVAVLLDK